MAKFLSVQWDGFTNLKIGDATVHLGQSIETSLGRLSLYKAGAEVFVRISDPLSGRVKKQHPIKTGESQKGTWNVGEHYAHKVKELSPVGQVLQDSLTRRVDVIPTTGISEPILHVEAGTLMSVDLPVRKYAEGGTYGEANAKVLAKKLEALANEGVNL